MDIGCKSVGRRGMSRARESKMPPKQKFQEGEKVLCYHGPLIYEAKCQQARYDEKEKTYQYHIHYSGWKKSWDEWVPEARVLHLNDSNLKKQVEVKKAQKAETKSKKKKKSSTVKEKKCDGDEAFEERGKERSSKGESGQPVTAINIQIGEALQDHLAEDWSRINLENKLVRLPASETVDRLIESYLADREKKESPYILQIHQEVAYGIREYFSVMIGTQLLYEPERDQYNEILGKYGKEENMSSIYGGIHLVRMLTRLGWCMGYAKFDEMSVDFLINNIDDFICFLTSKAGAIFGNESYTSGKDN